MKVRVYYPPQSFGVMNWTPHPDLVRMFEAQWPLMQQLHRYGSLAPCATWMDNTGGIHGDAFVVEDPAESPGAEWVVGHFAQQYRQRLDARSMRAGAVFFHGELIEGQVTFAGSAETANAIVALLEAADGQSALAVVPYGRTADGGVEGWQYVLPPAFYPAAGLPVPPGGNAG